MKSISDRRRRRLQGTRPFESLAKSRGGPKIVEVDDFGNVSRTQGVRTGTAARWGLAGIRPASRRGLKRQIRKRVPARPEWCREVLLVGSRRSRWEVPRTRRRAPRRGGPLRDCPTLRSVLISKWNSELESTPPLPSMCSGARTRGSAKMETLELRHARSDGRDLR